MGHSSTLLGSIAADLRKSYPEPEFKFVFEANLRMMDRHYQPDIQVFDQQGTLCCVVEIGYTRPEKLVEYYRQAIPDIRWYDKRECRLIPFVLGNAERQQIIQEIVYHPRRAEKPRLVTIYVRHSAKCPHRTNRYYRRCDCRKWLYVGGSRHPISAKTSSWAEAQQVADELRWAKE